MEKISQEVISEVDLDIFVDVLKLLLKGESCSSAAEKCKVDIEKVNWIRGTYLNLGS